MRNRGAFTVRSEFLYGLRMEGSYRQHCFHEIAQSLCLKLMSFLPTDRTTGSSRIPSSCIIRVTLHPFKVSTNVFNCRVQYKVGRVVYDIWGYMQCVRAGNDRATLRDHVMTCGNLISFCSSNHFYLNSKLKCL